MKTILLIITMTISLVYGNQISIVSSDGYKLFGELKFPKIKKKNYPIAMFFHQFGSDHTSWNHIAKALRKEGFATLSVDLRGHGKSIKKSGKNLKVSFSASSPKAIKNSFSISSKKVNFSKIPEDMSAWIDKISNNKKINPDEMVALGSSFGASNLIEIIEDYEFKKVVLISIGHISKDGTQILQTSSSKFLTITSKNDILEAQKRSYIVLDNAISAKMIMLQGSNHGTSLLNNIEPMVIKFITD
jgi:pimeloyl-ACP methyl ester carboxylesterase